MVLVSKCRCTGQVVKKTTVQFTKNPLHAALLHPEILYNQPFPPALRRTLPALMSKSRAIGQAAGKGALLPRFVIFALLQCNGRGAEGVLTFGFGFGGGLMGLMLCCAQYFFYLFIFGSKTFLIPHLLSSRKIALKLSPFSVKL